STVAGWAARVGGLGLIPQSGLMLPRVTVTRAEQAGREYLGVDEGVAPRQREVEQTFHPLLTERSPRRDRQVVGEILDEFADLEALTGELAALVEQAAPAQSLLGVRPLVPRPAPQLPGRISGEPDTGRRVGDER